jgi:hypothetical protein
MSSVLKVGGMNLKKPGSRQGVYRRKSKLVAPLWEVPEIKIDNPTAALHWSEFAVWQRLSNLVRTKRIGVCTNTVHSRTPKQYPRLT